MAVITEIQHHLKDRHMIPADVAFTVFQFTNNRFKIQLHKHRQIDKFESVEINCESKKEFAEIILKLLFPNEYKREE